MKEDLKEVKKLIVVKRDELSEAELSEAELSEAELSGQR
jgi:hypothetical protein